MRSEWYRFNVCVFGYGQTGAGKTYTMAGDIAQPGTRSASRNCCSSAAAGIVRLAVRQLFDHIAANPSHRFIIKMSCMEIYEEKIVRVSSHLRCVADWRLV